MKHEVTVRKIDDGQVRPRWCNEHVGVQGSDWDHCGVTERINTSDDLIEEVKYVFRRKKDAVFFALRWIGVDE